MHFKRLANSFGSRLIDDYVPIRGPDIPDREYAAVIYSFLSALADPAGDFLLQISTVVFGKTLKYGFENNTFRTVRDRFLRVLQGNSGLPEPHLIDGYILPIPAEPVNLPHNHTIKAVMLGVSDHTKKLITAGGGLSADMAIRVDLYNIDTFALSVGFAVRDLPFD